MQFPISLHLLAAVLWIGGMFFALLVVRPLCIQMLDPGPARLKLMLAIQGRFLKWIGLFVLVLQASGYWMLTQVMGGFNGLGWHVNLMLLLGNVMTLLYLYAYLFPYRKAKAYARDGKGLETAIQMERIRKGTVLNLTLGIILVLSGSMGRYTQLQHEPPPDTPEPVTQSETDQATPTQTATQPAAQPVTEQAEPPANQTPPPPSSPKVPEVLETTTSRSLFQARLDATKIWLNGEQSSNRTIQVMLLSGQGVEKNMNEILGKLDPITELPGVYIYAVKNGSGQKFGITYGNFRSPEQAQLAKDQLPGVFHSRGSQIRSVKGIRDETAKSASGSAR